LALLAPKDHREQV
jgi:hypothetical protein